MKTQLLEDIGQSATLSLVPSGRVLDSTLHTVVQDVVQPRPAKPRSAFGVWRQKPEGEPVVPAAMEVQHVASEAVNDAASSSPEPTLGAHIAPAFQGPVFDFTPPTHPTPALDPFTPAPTRLERSGRRYLLWGACVLAGALVIQGGMWLYEERLDASALVANEQKAEPQVDKVVKRRAIAVKEFTLGPDGEVSVAPVAPASLPSPVPTPAPIVPPLVLLEAQPAPDVKVEAAPAADPKVIKAPAAPKTVAALPKRVRQAERAQLVRVAQPIRANVERAPVAEKKVAAVSPDAAMLKACKEHGYQAAQCVRRACSVTKYGFVCRGK